MSIVPMSTAPDMASDAIFRTWGGAISAALSSIGWIQGGDTGQINWTTVTKPTLINTAAGFEIWRMNHTLQATKPVFLKIEYGCSGALSIPAIWITVGTGTNGAGTLTGQVGARQIIGPGSGTTGVTASYFSGNTSRLTAYLWDSVSYYTLIMIERTHDGAGADTNLGVTVGLGLC